MGGSSKRMRAALAWILFWIRRRMEGDMRIVFQNEEGRVVAVHMESGKLSIVGAWSAEVRVATACVRWF